MFYTNAKAQRSRFVRVCVAAAWIVAAASARPALATWSIILVDTHTKEIAVGSATCLTGFDLQQNLPVIVPGVGAACAQALVDTTAANRAVIRNGLLNGTWPSDIIEILAQGDALHQSRQYGIVDVRGRTATFSGTNNGDFAAGVTGQVGTIAFAIQGNVLTGAPVIEAARQAIIDTPGDLPSKLMAAMEAATAMGGDGRCSCDVLFPDFCGSPPPKFDKASHIAFMIGVRIGDTLGVCDSNLGCATGDYFMDFNIAFQTEEDPDPVATLRAAFDKWRAQFVGLPDGVQSIVTVNPTHVPAEGKHLATMVIDFRDWMGNGVDTAKLDVTVGHAAASAGISSIIPVSISGGELTHALNGGNAAGKDIFRVTINDMLRPVMLMPDPTLIYVARADLDHDGDVDLHDHAEITGCFGGPDEPVLPECQPSDLDDNNFVDLEEAKNVQNSFSGGPCVDLHIDSFPRDASIRCGFPLDLAATFTADPPPSFQWTLNGEPILGATSASYLVLSVNAVDQGDYQLRMSNVCGEVFSESIFIRVFATPCD